MEIPESSQASEVESFRMIDVGNKLATVRTAWAEGRIFLSQTVLEKVANKSLPKGDALALAEVAGIMAAKNTAALIPLCHPLPLDAVRVCCSLEPDKSSILVEAEVRATAKTGVEMEALVAVQAGLLTIYDLCKGTDPALIISDTRLVRKEGGKQGLWLHPQTDNSLTKKSESIQKQALEDIRAAVVTISDRCHAGLAEDRSGTALIALVEGQGGKVCRHILVPDEISFIQREVSGLVENYDLELILCTGGTGLSPRDRTPEAVQAIWDKSIPGFGELLRSSGAKFTPHSYLSRSSAGVLGKSLVVLFPGSPKAVAEGFAALLPLLRHAFNMIRGDHH